MSKIYTYTYCLPLLEDLVLIRGWRMTSTSAPSSSEELSSEDESPEDPSSHEKSERSENSSSLSDPKFDP
jgi:hypothetical protein